MRVVWAILCESTVQDKDTNNISIFNVIDELRFAGPPPELETEDPAGPYIPIQLVVHISRSDFDIGERGLARVKVVTPTGFATTSQEFEIDLSANLRHQLRLTLSEFPPLFAGCYKFLIDCKSDGGEWEEPFELLLLVKFGLSAAT